MSYWQARFLAHLHNWDSSNLDTWSFPPGSFWSILQEPSPEVYPSCFCCGRGKKEDIISGGIICITFVFVLIQAEDWGNKRIRIWKCQNLKVSESEGVRIWKCLNLNASEFERFGKKLLWFFIFSLCMATSLPFRRNRQFFLWKLAFLED